MRLIPYIFLTVFLGVILIGCSIVLFEVRIDYTKELQQQIPLKAYEQSPNRPESDDEQAVCRDACYRHL